MELKGRKRIDAPRETVWRLLNDADVLKASLKGCEQMEWDGENSLKAVVRTKIGPINARFRGRVRLENLKAPESYTLAGEGQGGASGFVKGAADVQLIENGGATELVYSGRAMVGGKLAQVGARLLDRVAHKMTEDFFRAFSEHVAKTAP